MAKILLVEDNEMNRDLISRRLKRKGYEVALAVDGAEGVQRASNEPPDLIVMDMGLPILSGYEAARMLKAKQATKDIPIVGLSARAMSGDSEKALEAGCDDYDTKPVDWPRLLAKIDSLLKQSPSRQMESVDAPPETASSAETIAGVRDHILLVDDSPMVREVVGGRLAELGKTYEIAESVEVAFEKGSHVRFSAILLDVAMADADNRNVLQELRTRIDAPIVVLTSVDATDQAIGCLTHGASDFVPQPFHREVLAARLDAAISGTKKGSDDREVQKKLAEERQRSEHLLRVMMPGEIVAELKSTQKILPRRHRNVAVLSAELVGFHDRSDDTDLLRTFARLQELITSFEDVADRRGLVKVKTFGEVLIATAGLFEAVPNPVMSCIRTASDFLDVCKRQKLDWPIRFGVDVGSVIAAVVGRRQYQFDVWGKPVATAEAVRRQGRIGAITISAEAADRVTGLCLLSEASGSTEDAEGRRAFVVEKLAAAAQENGPTSEP